MTSMTSTDTVPETSFPVDSVEPAQIVKEQGIEALRDIVYGSVSRRTRLYCVNTNPFSDRLQAL